MGAIESLEEIKREGDRESSHTPLDAPSRYILSLSLSWSCVALFVAPSPLISCTSVRSAVETDASSDGSGDSTRLKHSSWRWDVGGTTLEAVLAFCVPFPHFHSSAF